MATTFTKIASVSVGSGGAGNISFTSIPQNFTDLVVLISGRISYAGTVAGTYINFNADFTAGNYARLYLQGDGSAVSSFSSNSVIGIGTLPASTSTANTFGNVSTYISNYTSSVTKSVSVDSVLENNGATGGLNLVANYWTGTAAINQMVIYSDGGNLSQYSTATLYGIKKN